MRNATKWAGVLLIAVLICWSGTASASSPSLTGWATSNGASENASLDAAAQQYATALVTDMSTGSMPGSPSGVEFTYQTSDTVADAEALLAMPAADLTNSAWYEGSGSATLGTYASVVVFWQQKPLAPVVPVAPVTPSTTPTTTPVATATTVTTVPAPVVTTTTIPVVATGPSAPSTAGTTSLSKTVVSRVSASHTVITNVSNGTPRTTYSGEDKSSGSKTPVKGIAISGGVGLIGLLMFGIRKLVRV